LIGPLLGLLFLAYPFRALFASDPSPARLAFTIADAALFVGVFLRTIWLYEPTGVRAMAPPEVRRRRASVAFLGASAVLLSLLNGLPWLTLFVYTSIAAGLMLKERDAYVTIATLAVLLVLLGRAMGEGWSDAARLLVPMVALGLLFAAFTRQVAAVAELRAAREELARLAVAEERLRFARDLHDLLGHSLSAIALKTALAARLLPDVPETKRAEKEIRDAEGVARGALKEVREAVAGYRRPTLAEELGGARAMLEAAGIACEIADEAGELPPRADAVLAWTVREGTTNVIRHSGARRCEIRLERGTRGVEVEIRDDGRGPAGGSSAGSGLSGLTERVADEGGCLEAGSGPVGGFRLRVFLPLPEAPSPNRPEAEGTGVSRGGSP
jgi:two-component system sensor histidine kinase DesK